MEFVRARTASSHLASDVGSRAARPAGASTDRLEAGPCAGATAFSAAIGFAGSCVSVSGDCGECARTLVQAVFRLAFCDYIGSAYGHDEPGPDKWIRLNAVLQADAEKFLTSVWGAHLADLAGMTAKMIWKQAQRDLLHRPARLLVNREGSESDPFVSRPVLDPGLVGHHAEARRAA